MSYDNQHSHIFLLDIGNLGDSKSKPGVNRIGQILRDIVRLATQSSETLIKSLGIIISTQVSYSRVCFYAKFQFKCFRGR